MSLPPPAEHPLIQAANAETETQDAILESRLGADPPTPESFARVEAALAPTFTLIGLDGRREYRDAVIAALQAERGARGPDFRIRVEAPEPVALEPPVVVLAYRERQWLAGVETLRQSTAVFRSDGEAPNGLRWLTLQETWMKG